MYTKGTLFVYRSTQRSIRGTSHVPTSHVPLRNFQNKWLLESELINYYILRYIIILIYAAHILHHLIGTVGRGTCDARAHNLTLPTIDET